MKKLFPIKGYEGVYGLTMDGRVWSYPKLRKRSGYLHNGVWLKQIPNIDGYWVVYIRDNGKNICVRVHRLLAMTFIPNPYNKCCVNHKDGDKQNNQLDNLEWCSVKENVEHASIKGLRIIGGAHHWSKLNEAQILAIRKILEYGKLSHKKISQIFRVSKPTITAINTRRNWKHVT